MKRLLLSLAMLLTVPAGIAADPTRDLLFADRAGKFIRFTFDPGPTGDRVLMYAVDSFDPTDLNPVPPGLTIRANRRIKIFLGNHNPLKQSYTIAMKRTEDPSYAALTKFLTDVQEAQKALGPSVTPTGAGIADRAQLKGCKLFEALLFDAHEALDKKEYDADKLRKAVDGATGFKGVTDAATSFGNAIREINGDPTLKSKGSIDIATEALQEIADKFGSSPGKPASQSCDDQGLIITYNNLLKKADKIIVAKKDLAKSLQSLIDFLQPYLVQTSWRGKSTNVPELTDYPFDKSAEVDFEKLNEVTVEAVVKDVTLEGGVVKVSENSKTKVTAAFVARQDSFVVPERAAALIYNRITYPKYGTTVKDGKTVVDRVKDDDPVNGAIMLNLIPRLGGVSVAYPFLQVGVSSAKEFPGFLAGVGIRFTGPVAWSASVGGMITRFKDLDQSLHVGDEVTGTADIEKHLQWRFSPVKVYGALQLKF